MVTLSRIEAKVGFYSDLSLFDAVGVVVIARHLTDLFHQFQFQVGDSLRCQIVRKLPPYVQATDDAAWSCKQVLVAMWH